MTVADFSQDVPARGRACVLTDCGTVGMPDLDLEPAIEAGRREMAAMRRAKSAAAGADS